MKRSVVARSPDRATPATEGLPMRHSNHQPPILTVEHQPSSHGTPVPDNPRRRKRVSRTVSQ